MSWEALGSIAEMLGAIAVLITLFYIAKQVSETKSALERQSIYDINFAFNQIHIQAAGSPELALGLSKMEEGQALTPQERVQIRSYVIAQFNAFETTWMHMASQNHQVEEVAEMILWFLGNPGVSDMWEELKGATSLQFQEFVSSARDGI